MRRCKHPSQLRRRSRARARNSRRSAAQSQTGATGATGASRQSSFQTTWSAAADSTLLGEDLSRPRRAAAKQLCNATYKQGIYATAVTECAGQ
eukprot:5288520-Prymnesium_polylepis.1